jgi:hypothetical protein
MMALRHSCLLILLNLSLSGWSQSWSFVRSQEIPQEITTIDVGATGKIFLGTDRGNIYSFLVDGTPYAEFSSAIFQPVTSLNAANSLRIFVFYKDIYTFEYLERFTAFPRSYSLADFGISGGEFATVGLNNTIWVINGNELIQLNPVNRSILQTIILEGQLNKVVALHVSDNIFIADNDGIQLFSMSGKLLSDVSAKGIKSMQVDQATVITVCDQGILAWNGVTTLSSIDKLPGDFTMMVISGDYHHFVRGSSLYTYRFQK